MSIEELDERVEELNGLFTGSSDWCRVRAAKDYRDEHNVKIKRGDWYYKRTCGMIDPQPFRYSMPSMERFVRAVFANNPLLSEVSRKVRERRTVEVYRAIECLDR